MTRNHRLVPLSLALGLLAALTVTGLSPAAADGTTPVDTDYGRLVLVLDSSGSMKEPAGDGGTKIDAAKTALHQVVADLPAQADVGLRVFGATVFSRKDPGACTDSQLVVPPATDNRPQLDAAVDSYTPYGETPIAYSLTESAKDIGSEGTRSIVLVSDGEATCAPDPCDVAAQIASQGIDLQIDVVGLSVSGKARAQLKCIAAAGGGRYYDASSASDISASIAQAAERAVRPFEVEGLPVVGGATSDLAADLGTGTFSDTIGAKDTPDGEKWYRVTRSLEKSTLLVSTVLLSAGDALDNSIAVELTSQDGTTCGRGASVAPVNSASVLGSGAFTNMYDDSPDATSPCLGDEVLVHVSRPFTGDGQDSRYSLRVMEEPAVLDPTSLPPTQQIDDAPYVAPTTSGDATAITGGRSFGDATAITSGTAHAGTIVPGETQVFTIPVTWGQTLSVQSLTPAASPALRDSDQFRDGASVQIFNPLGMEIIDQPDGRVGVGNATGPEPGSIEKGTIPVQFNNRYSTSTTYLAGDYYVVYAADRIAGSSIEMPFTLKVEVQGQEAGVPTFAVAGDDASSPGQPVAEATDSDTPTSPAPAAASSDPSASDASDSAMSTPVKLAAAGGLGLIAIVCATIGVLVLRRPRA